MKGHGGAAARDGECYAVTKRFRSKACSRVNIIIHGACELVGQHGERFGFAVLVCQFRKIVFAGLVLSQEEDGRFRTGPAQMPVADLLTRGPEPFAARFLSTLHQATIGDEILHPFCFRAHSCTRRNPQPSPLFPL